MSLFYCPQHRRFCLRLRRQLTPSAERSLHCFDRIVCTQIVGADHASPAGAAGTMKGRATQSRFSHEFWSGPSSRSATSSSSRASSPTGKGPTICTQPSILFCCISVRVHSNRRSRVFQGLRQAQAQRVDRLAGPFLRPAGRAGLAVGQIILLHPTLPSVGVPIGMERGCQQK